MNTGKGVIFDLLRFSLHDGPGIRTIVFLKGCPLKCEWCHNPESQSIKPQLLFNPEKCIDCFECVNACSHGVHKISNEKHYVDWNFCKTEGNCVNVCSSGALKLIGKEFPVNEIMEEIKKDMKYYRKSNGGVTISGGEPLYQFDFTKALLIALKSEGIHTCIDTCGFVKEDYYNEILPYTDLFLFDYKLTDNKQHKRYTNARNDLILSNLDFLYGKGASIILRCPIIPGINNNEEHFNGIKTLIEKYPNLKSVELMPYHRMGRDKSINIGQEYKLNYIKEADNLEKQNWIKYIIAENSTVPVSI